MSRRRQVLLGAVAAVLAAGLLVPGVRAGIKAPGTLAESLDRSWPRPLAPEVERRSVVIGGVPGERYSGKRVRPPVVLVPGATPAGLADTRTIRAATAIARAGRDVFVPELELYGQDLVVEDIARVSRAAVALADEAGEPVALVGFSFGGAMALLAAAEQELAGRVAVVGVFGAYWDLEGYAQAAATGVSLVAGTEITWNAAPQAPELFREQVARLATDAERAALTAALEGDDDPSDLSGEAAALHGLITHDDPTRTAALFEALPPRIQDHLRRMSPASVADRITAPVVALHDRDDPAVPYGELLRLGRDLPEARVLTVELFEHVDLDADRAWHELLGDFPDSWRFSRAILSPQEGFWPW